MDGIVIEEHFRGLIDIARELLEQQEDKDHILPVDLYDPLPDFWDEWFDPVLEAWTPDVRRNLREFFLSEMRLHPAEVLPRYVALAVYDGLIQYLTSPNWEERRLAPKGRSIRTDTGIRIDLGSWHPVVDELRQDCRAVLRSVATSTISTWRDIEWEISNSCLMEDWDRVGKLYERAKELESLDEGVLLLLQAQFQFLLAWRDSPAGPLQTDMRKDNYAHLRNWQFPFHPCNWEPKLYNSVDSFSSLLFFAGALDISTVSREASVPHRQALRAAIEALERAKEYLQLPAPYPALLGRCYFTVGLFYEAAAHYEGVLEAKLSVMWRDLRPYVYCALSDSYLSAEEPTKAINALKSCSLEFPEKADIYLKTAKLQGENTDYFGALETIRTAVDKLPGIDTDWRLTTMLAIGDLSAVKGLSAVKVDPERRDNLVSLLGEYWPSFVRLSPRAREEWTDGTFQSHFFLNDKSMSNGMVKSGYGKLALAVEIELREKVFVHVLDHFRRERTELNELIRGELMKPEESKNNDLIPFCEFVRSKRRSLVTLGFCEKVLGFCRQSNTPIFVALREWVEDRFPRLLPNADLLKGIVKFRNGHSHGTDSMMTVDDVPDKCRKIIETLHEQGPAPSSAPIRF